MIYLEMEPIKRALLCTQRHSWEQGVAMQAFLEAGEDETVFLLAKEAVNRRLPDGRLAVMDDVNAVTDPCSVGEALASAMRKTGDPELADALEGLRHWALEDAPRSREGVLYHVMNGPEFWSDSLYMLPPFLAAIGEGEAAMLQLNGLEAALLDPASGLLAHRWHDGEKRFLRADHWGGGQGWALAGYARLIDLLPEYRPELIRRARALIDHVLPWMREDGLFHDVIDDPSTFVETNLSQMLCYTLCRGMNRGWLDESFSQTAERLHNGALSRTDEHGIVHGVCGAPFFDRPGCSPEGQAFLLMMELQWNQWKEKKYAAL